MRDYLAEAEEHLSLAYADNSIDPQGEERRANTVAAVGSLEALQRIAASLETLVACSQPARVVLGESELYARDSSCFVSERTTAPGSLIADAEAVGDRAVRRAWGILGGPEGAL